MGIKFERQIRGAPRVLEGLLKVTDIHRVFEGCVQMRPFEHVSGEYLIGQVSALKPLRYSEHQLNAQRYINPACRSEIEALIIAECSRNLDRSLEDLKCIGTRTKEAVLCGLPVDDVPDVLHICSFAVQVLPKVSITSSK